MKRFRKHYKLLEKKKAYPLRKNKHHKDPRAIQGYLKCLGLVFTRWVRQKGGCNYF